MRIVIVGDGKVGFTLVESLSREGHDVTVIDSNSSVLEQSLEQLDVMVLNGSGVDLTVLRQAGAGDADVLISVTGSDEVNLLSCMLAKKIGCKYTIARVRRPEFEEAMRLIWNELDLNMTFNPELETAREISRLIRFPSFIQMDSFVRGRVQIVELPVHEGDKLDQVLLAELNRIVRAKVLVCAVERGEETFIPSGRFRLQAGDKIFVTAPVEELSKLINSLNIAMRKVRSVLLIGGSRIAEHLAAQLLEQKIEVKIIDIDRDRCEYLAMKFPRAQVIHADGTVQSVLMDAGIEEADVVVSLTNIDEENVLISMMANHLHVPKSITKINRLEYTALFRENGIDSVISPRSLASHNILRFVRGIDNTSSNDMLTLHRIANDQVEALEFQTTENTLHLGEKLSEIQLKPNILIACIMHRSRISIPDGNSRLELGDTVIVVTRADQTLHELNDIFEEDTSSILADQQILLSGAEQDG